MSVIQVIMFIYWIPQWWSNQGYLVSFDSSGTQRFTRQWVGVVNILLE